MSRQVWSLKLPFLFCVCARPVWISNHATDQEAEGHRFSFLHSANKIFCGGGQYPIAYTPFPRWTYSTRVLFVKPYRTIFECVKRIDKRSDRGHHTVMKNKKKNHEFIRFFQTECKSKRFNEFDFFISTFQVIWIILTIWFNKL